MIKHITVKTKGQGLTEFTAEVEDVVRGAGVREGLCTVFIQHTSASLLIQENADPAVKHDLEHWMNRLVQENDSLYTHLNEGPDDMPGHIRSTLTATTLSIPVSNGRLALGTWQGLFVWEHRHRGGNRRVVVHLHC